MLWPRPSRPPRSEEYRNNVRTYYRSKPRPRRTKQKPTASTRIYTFPIYAVIAFLLAFKFTGVSFVHSPPPALVDTPSLSERIAQENPHPVSAEAMRPPQFGAHPHSHSHPHPHPHPHHPASHNHHPDIRVVDLVRSLDDDDSEQGEHTVRFVPDRDAVANLPHALKQVSDEEKWVRRCYFSSRTGDSLCVHAPFCVRHNAIVYMSETLRCAAYTNKQGKPGTLSMGRCVELEREMETIGEIEQVEHKPRTWMNALERDDKVLWFEGDSVFLKMGRRCTGVLHFAERVLMLHHILQHPERYGMGGVSNVIIAAEEEVAKKIRYTKSWHHGLLTAVVYPNRLIYSHREMRDAVSTTPREGEIRVFVAGGEWDVARGRLVPCFRRAALAGAVRSQLFLTAEVYPGMIDDTIPDTKRYHDADVFRTLLFQSLGLAHPTIKKEIIYLHRATTRTLTEAGLSALESKLREVSADGGFSYRLLDVAKLTFPQQVSAVAGAGVVVGIHGTQMLNTLFLPSGAAVVEIFPYGFSHHLFERGSGAGLHYASHQVNTGEEFGQLAKFHGLRNCLRVSSECRSWYQSDHRPLDFGLADAVAVGTLVEKAMAHVKKGV